VFVKQISAVTVFVQQLEQAVTIELQDHNRCRTDGIATVVGTVDQTTQPKASPTRLPV
jgi:hypothetical protein